MLRLRDRCYLASLPRLVDLYAQLLDLLSQALLVNVRGERDRGQRGERLDDRLQRRLEWDHLPCLAVERVDKLDHADHPLGAVLERHRQERSRAIAGLAVESAGARE